METTPSNNKPRKGCFRWGLRAAGIILLVITALGLIGWLLEPGALNRDLERHPAPGDLITVDGHDMHLWCVGEGSPTVLVDAGLGSDSMQWQQVQPEVAGFTRICTYDRAGYGWSEPGPAPRTTDQIVTELHALVEASDIEQPFVLVGHSRGGQHVQVYAARYPEDIAGLVLVDPAPLELPGEQIEAVTKGEASQASMMKGLGFLSRIGALRLAANLGFVPTPAWAESLPEEYQDAVLYIGSDVHYFRTLAAELEARDTSQEQLAASGPLPDVPLTLIHRGLPQEFPGFEQADADAVNQKWEDAHKALVEAAPQGQLVIAEQSGHNVMLNQPEIIIEVIREMVNLLRD